MKLTITNIKEIAIILLCLILSGSVVYLDRKVYLEWPRIDDIINHTIASSNNIDNGTKDSRELIAKVNTFCTPDQLQQFYNTFETTAHSSKITADSYSVLARHTARAMDTFHDQLTTNGNAFNLVIGDLHKIAQTINNETLPDLTRTTAASRDFINTTTDKIAITFDKINSSIDKEKIDALFDNSNKTLDNFNQLMVKGGTTLDIVNNHLPTSLDRSNEILTNISGLTFKLNKYAGKALEPQTLREKIVSGLLIQGGITLLKQAPVLVPFLFKR